MSRTYVLMQVSPATYNEIAQKLRDAGYDHALHLDDGHGNATALDMHGIALSVAPASVPGEKAGA